jgi:hypothetical protein
MATQDVTTHVMGVAQFERFFRVAASLDIDKDDIKRFDDFVNRKLHDLLVRAQATAKANIRDVIEPYDLPITKGLQECIHAFGGMNEEIPLQSILERLTYLPRLDMASSPETEAELPVIAGGIAVALARSFKILDPELKNPQSVHWERAFRLFDLLL